MTTRAATSTRATSLVKTYVSPAADEMLGEALETPESEGPHEPQLGRPRAQAMSFSSKAMDDSYYAGGNVHARVALSRAAAPDERVPAA